MSPAAARAIPALGRGGSPARCAPPPTLPSPLGPASPMEPRSPLPEAGAPPGMAMVRGVKPMSLRRPPWALRVSSCRPETHIAASAALAACGG